MSPHSLCVYGWKEMVLLMSMICIDNYEVDYDFTLTMIWMMMILILMIIMTIMMIML